VETKIEHSLCGQSIDAHKLDRGIGATGSEASS
jgi:hypothetical protein